MTDLNRRDFLKVAGIGIAAVLGIRYGGEALKYFQQHGNSPEQEGTPKTLPEHLQAGLNQLNEVAKYGIKENHLDSVGINLGDYAKNRYVRKQIEVAKAALQDKDRVKTLIQENQPAPIFFYGNMLFTEASEAMIDHGLAVAENLTNLDKGILFVNSAKFEHVGTIGENTFIVAVRQESALNKTDFDNHKDLFLIQGQENFSGEAPLFSLVDMATTGENGSIKWLDAANQKTWDSSSLAKDKTITGDFNPNPLLQL